MDKAEVRAKIKAEIRELEEKVWANRIYHFREGGIWSPNGDQRRLLDGWKLKDKSKFTFTGGNRKGKTTIAILIAYSVLFGEFVWSGEKLEFPHKEPRRVMYVGQGWETHIKQTVEPELRKLWPICRRVETRKNNQGVDAVWIDVETGSLLQVMSNNQESDSFEGGQWDLIVWDEPPSRANRVAATRGLIDRGGRELFAATLIKEAWMHREVIKARLADGSPDPSVFNVDGKIYDNVSRCKCGGFIVSEELRDGVYWGMCERCGEVRDYVRWGLTLGNVENFGRNLKGAEREARLEGKPSYLGNLVLPNFSRDTHCVRRFQIPLNWVTDVSIDFHPSKAWAVLFVSTGPNNFKYASYAIHEKGSPKYIAEEIIRIAKSNELFINSITIDPLAKGDANAHADETVFKVMEKVFKAYNYKLDTASKEKENGITLINDLLMTENEMPALFFFNDLGIVIEQVEDWMYDPETFKASKVNDDFCEVLYRIILRNTQWQDPYEREARLNNLPHHADMGEIQYG